MATPLPTIQVSDEQLAALMEVFGDAAGYRNWLKGQLISAVKQHKIGEVQVVYQQRLTELDAQYAAALAEVDLLLDNLGNP